MKKIIILLFFICLTLIYGCSDTVSNSAGDGNGKINSNELVIETGDKAVTANTEIFFKDVEITYDVIPKEYDGSYSHYMAEPGYIYISVSVEVKNKSDKSLKCSEIGKVTADYNDGRKYVSFTVAEGKDGGFLPAHEAKIEPEETCGIRFLIKCPQEIQERKFPLILYLEIDNSRFKYNEKN